MTTETKSAVDAHAAHGEQLRAEAKRLQSELAEAQGELSSLFRHAAKERCSPDSTEKECINARIREIEQRIADNAREMDENRHLTGEAEIIVEREVRAVALDAMAATVENLLLTVDHIIKHVNGTLEIRRRAEGYIAEWSTHFSTFQRAHRKIEGINGDGRKEALAALPAKAKMPINPDNFHAFFKREIGTPGDAYNGHGNEARLKDFAG